MRYINKNGDIIVYKRDYQRERDNATGYVNIDTISFRDKMEILSIYVYEKLSVNDVVLKTRKTHAYISRRKVKSLVNHYRKNEDEYYECVGEIYRRMF